MSISNTATKVEEFEVGTTESFQVGEELSTPSKIKSTPETKEREEFDASAKSLDATQLYLGEIGFFSTTYRRRRSTVCSSRTARRRSST